MAGSVGAFAAFSPLLTVASEVVTPVSALRAAVSAIRAACNSLAAFSAASKFRLRIENCLKALSADSGPPLKIPLVREEFGCLGLPLVDEKGFGSSRVVRSSPSGWNAEAMERNTGTPWSPDTEESEDLKHIVIYLHGS